MILLHLRRVCAAVLLAAGLGGIVPLCAQVRDYPAPTGSLIAAGFLQQTAFLALGSYLFHAPLEAARLLRCGSLFLMGYLMTGFGLFQGLLEVRTSYAALPLDVVAGPGIPQFGSGNHLALLSLQDAVATLVLAILPFLLPKPDRRQFLLTLASLALGFSLRPYLYASLLSS